MNQIHKDDATRRLGRALVYIISLANEDQAAEAERDSEVPSASAAVGTLDAEERRERSCRAELNDIIKAISKGLCQPFGKSIPLATRLRRMIAIPASVAIPLLVFTNNKRTKQDGIVIFPLLSIFG